MSMAVTPMKASNEAAEAHDFCICLDSVPFPKRHGEKGMCRACMSLLM